MKVGRYEIIRELGRGGMAVVYLARDPKFKRQVAIKVLPQQLTFDPQFRARFEREAEVIAGLEHPAIVPVFDFGEEKGLPYLVMRHMPGGSMRERLEKGQNSPQEVSRIIARLAPALDKASKRGVIHRDLKPENILFDDEDEPYISDFGIAKLTESSSALTGTGIIGSPGYMSPEQVSGQGKLDGRSDQYALGAIAFEMLIGKTLFEGDTPIRVMMAHVGEKPRSLLQLRNDLPAALNSALQKALSKRPNDRFDTVKEFSIAVNKASVSYEPKITSELIAKKERIKTKLLEKGKRKKAFKPAPSTRLLERQTVSRPKEESEETNSTVRAGEDDGWPFVVLYLIIGVSGIIFLMALLGLGFQR